MIRFLNLKNQITEGSTDFAFYDTISDTILCFGENAEQVFGSVQEFKFDFGDPTDHEGTTRPLTRFLSLIPDDFFNLAEENM